MFNSVLGLLVRLKLAKPFLSAVARAAHKPERRLRPFIDYAPSSHDVMVCTYAKSGTTWALQIVTQVAYLGEAEFDYIHHIVPWSETQHRPGMVTMAEPTYELAPTGLRAVKTHNNADFVPYNENARYLVIVRDPKDVLVSSYHFIGALFPPLRKLPFDDWMLLFLLDKSIFGSWPFHVASYWKWRDRTNVKILFFEEMKKNIAKCTEEVAMFMGVQLSGTQFQKVIEKSSFEYMKGIDHKFAPRFLRMASRDSGPIMMRSGKTGSASELMTQKKLDELDELMKKQLSKLGSDFPYERYYGRAM